MLKRSKKILNSLPSRLIICVIFAFMFGDQLDDTGIRFLYTISNVLKEILMAILPIVIFSYIFSAILSLEKVAPILIGVIIILVVISNAIVSYTAFGIANLIIPFVTTTKTLGVPLEQQAILPYFTLGMEQVLSSDKAMFLGAILGIYFCYFKNTRVSIFSNKLQHYVTIFLEKYFIPCLPLYILGFVLKMHREGDLEILFQNYAQVFVLICVSCTAYITLMYLVANNFSWGKFKLSIRQMSAAGITGFSTISSAVAVPLSIVATENNTGNSQFSKLIIPATVNIHMIGHGLSIPITALTIMMLCGHPLPSFEVISLFVVYFCIAKFSATAVPGGGIIVILPILQSQFGFTPEMSSIIIMLDILQDAVLTVANVMGNGAFAMICHNFCKRFKII